MKIEVYSDGSATTKDKPGGYGWVIVIDGKFHSEGSGGLPSATNNDMELEGAIMGLAHAFKLYDSYRNGLMSGIVSGPDPSVTLVSDSQIVLGWLSGTFRFKQLDKQQKYFQFIRLKKMMNVVGRWVEGHSGDEYNERCDKLAGKIRDELMGRVPRKKSTKSTLMLHALKEIAKIATENKFKFTGDRSLEEIETLCQPFLGKQ